MERKLSQTAGREQHMVKGSARFKGEGKRFGKIDRPRGKPAQKIVADSTEVRTLFLEKGFRSG